jgi:cellulose biosynthesis protein BcsQ
MNCPLVFPGLILLAEASGAAGQTPPTWTDKEVLVAVGSAIGTLFTVGVPLVLFLLRQLRAADKLRVRKMDAENQKLRTEVIRLQKDLQDATSGAVTGKVDLGEMKVRLQQAQQELQELLAVKASAEDTVATERRLAEKLKADLQEAQGNLAGHQEQLKGERRRIEKALGKDGQTWTEKVRANVPSFEPLDAGAGRRTPIISVLNLKGGVGKTTITANLGAALDGLGHRALLLDLDLQGSLTSLFLSEADQARLYSEERLVGDFLAASFDATYPNLLNYAQPILPSGQSGLVATTDQLAYAEMNLTIRWLLREGKDPRFMLRRELHLRRITKQYDVVLLDCPPLINVCCVNALAASDYVLVPILPSKQATARVPILLQRLKDFRENINPELKILGVVANRTHRSELTLEEQNRLSALRTQCKDIWGQDVPLLDTFIRQNAEVRAAEDEHRPLHQGNEMYEAFAELAREVGGRLPTFCRATGRRPTPAEEALS